MQLRGARLQFFKKKRVPLSYSSIQAFAIQPTFSLSSPTARFESNGGNILMYDSSQLPKKNQLSQVLWKILTGFLLWP
jgi:hypothetical protein